MKSAAAVIVLAIFTTSAAAQEQSPVKNVENVENVKNVENVENVENGQEEQQAGSRIGVIEEQQAEKAAAVTPAKPGKVEQAVARWSDVFLGGQMHWHPFFHNAYSGGGFT